jgi:ribosomal protein S18 acetylase RimI-like enzyme
MPPKSAGARMRIHMFGVAPEFQGKGYGKILLRAAIDRMQQEGAKSVELTVDEKNATALALYDSFGFSLKNRSLWYEKKI